MFEMRTWARCFIPMSRYVAPYYPTPDHIVDRMLRVASVGSGDVVFDLGCGDGKVRQLAWFVTATGTARQSDAAKAHIWGGWVPNNLPCSTPGTASPVQFCSIPNHYARIFLQLPFTKPSPLMRCPELCYRTRFVAYTSGQHLEISPLLMTRCINSPSIAHSWLTTSIVDSAAMLLGFSS